jgi:hypothetical protein
MPNLEVLHLAGNGFHGELPNLDISTSLRDVNLAYNRLSGIIPDNFQVFPFNIFDISYNKITGTCSSLSMNISSQVGTTDLILQVNRLSGPLSSSFHSAQKINIVTGKLLYMYILHSLY